MQRRALTTMRMTMTIGRVQQEQVRALVRSGSDPVLWVLAALAATALALLSAACGGHPAAVGADERLQPPPPEAMVLKSLLVAPAGSGLDLTGDGRPDNVLAFTGEMLNVGLGVTIVSGGVILLLKAVGLREPDVGEIRLGWARGIDPDASPDPASYFSGKKTFWLLPADTDERGEPKVGFAAKVAGDRLDARTDVNLQLGSGAAGAGRIAVKRLTVAARIGVGRDRLEHGLLCGAVPTAVLAAFPSPDRQGSLLDYVAVTRGVQPDVDLDGDGLETLLDQDADGLVDACKDGDGASIAFFSGVKDPHIADGFSVCVQFETVPARIAKP